ncbi:MAG: transpeptidase family protein [Dysgonamonadaceae bacterium]|jgi:cell division protein FtsI (penicillin-binding protein 3)|nr:transpeptidase family protein [Dysgonamonadaceae bacterium]
MASKQQNTKFNRYTLVAIFVVLFAATIFGKAVYISFVEGSAWRKIGEKQVRPNVRVPAMRGEIYSANYELMAATEAWYRLYIDFWAEGIKPEALKNEVGPLSVELHKLFPQKSAKQYEMHILNGWERRVKEAAQIANGKKVRKTREYRLLDHDVNYLDWKKIQQMPYFKRGRNNSGLYPKELVRRIKPYGTLASRTIGDIYSEFGKGGKNGLECYYDSLLRGQDGLSRRRKVNGRVIDIIDEKPVNGMDIVSTIDITIQDITETALLKKLKETDAESGTAVVMEVATGEVKAITNMGRIREGVWSETLNYAVSDLSEPGSTFKVASMMVALEDGLVHPEDPVDTENGTVKIAGQTLRDHNANRGGYGMITAEKSIRYSSNIGVARLITKAYGQHPEKFVEGIYKIGFHNDMHLEIPGYGVPKIRHPKDKAHFWSLSTLPWMSFGYETQIPPIYTLSFFNAIANDGKLVKPVFVREIQENGRTIEKKKTQVINEQICSPATLAAIRKMLDEVVNSPDGTGKPACSGKIRISGKTGTAQLSKGSAGYKAGGLSHQVSFCGYFPSGQPRYSCIIVIRKPRNGAPSGGLMCGTVFKEIAEEVYAQNIIYRETVFPADTLHPLTPVLKNGRTESALLVLKKLKIDYQDENRKEEWLTSGFENNRLILKDREISAERVPDVKGMGAKDALFAMESAGLRVNLSGAGSVVAQSVLPGANVVKGQTVFLQLK